MSEASNKKVLIVEDNSDLSEIYKTNLEISGYQVLQAFDGITALNLIESDQPDLVLMDLMVPAIAGDEILKRMRANEWGNKIPVHIISNLNEEDAPSGLRDLGVTGYSVKSTLGDEDLLNIVQSIIGGGEKR